MFVHVFFACKLLGFFHPSAAKSNIQITANIYRMNNTPFDIHSDRKQKKKYYYVYFFGKKARKRKMCSYRENENV